MRGRTRWSGQLTAPGITTESIKAEAGKVRRDLHVILPKGAQKSWTLQVTFKMVEPQVTRFAWKEKKGEYAELILTRLGTFTPCLRYMDRPFDASSPAARDRSYKVFHHLFDPTGTRFVTNGGHLDENVDPKKYKVWPHHRGIMYGFNKCSYETRPEDAG